MTESTIFARRQFHSDGEKCELIVYCPSPAGASYKCESVIDRPEGSVRLAAYGEDSMQALILALIQAGSTLYSADEPGMGRLCWLDPTQPGYFGMPVLDDDKAVIPGGPRMLIAL